MLQCIDQVRFTQNAACSAGVWLRSTASFLQGLHRAQHADVMPLINKDADMMQQPQKKMTYTHPVQHTNLAILNICNTLSVKSQVQGKRVRY